MNFDEKKIRQLCANVTMPIAVYRPVDGPFMPEDLLDSNGDYECIWYYVQDDEGVKHAAFACEEDAEFYAGARTYLPVALDEIIRLKKGLSDALGIIRYYAYSSFSSEEEENLVIEKCRVLMELLKENK